MLYTFFFSGHFHGQTTARGGRCYLVPVLISMLILAQTDQVYLILAFALYFMLLRQGPGSEVPGVIVFIFEAFEKSETALIIV